MPLVLSCVDQCPHKLKILACEPKHPSYKVRRLRVTEPQQGACWGRLTGALEEMPTLTDWRVVGLAWLVCPSSPARRIDGSSASLAKLINVILIFQQIHLTCIWSKCPSAVGGWVWHQRLISALIRRLRFSNCIHVARTQIQWTPDIRGGSRLRLTARGKSWTPSLESDYNFIYINSFNHERIITMPRTLWIAFPLPRSISWLPFS